MEVQAEPALQERFWQGDEVDFAWEGAAEGCFAAGDGVSAAADPHQPPGMWTHHSTGVAAKWQEVPGALAVASWQECQFLPSSGHILVPLAISVPEPGCVESGKALPAGVLLPPCSPQGWGCGSLGVPSLLGPWVGFPHRRSRRAGMEHSDRHPDRGAKCPWA